MCPGFSLSGVPGNFSSLKGVIYITITDWGRTSGRETDGGELWEKGSEVKDWLKIFRMIIMLPATLQTVSSWDKSTEILQEI